MARNEWICASIKFGGMPAAHSHSLGKSPITLPPFLGAIMMYVTRQVKFSAGHRLHNPLLSDEENVSIFDKCNNPNGHGHNYILEVTLSGEINPSTGYVYDLKKLKTIIYDEIVDKVDHKNLNTDVEFLKGINPTVENLAVAIWNLLANKFDEAKLYKIKIFETDTSFVEYYGE